LGLRASLHGADIVHTQELGYWYTMQAAKLKRRMNFRLVLTVWETIPLLDAYRNIRTRAYRALALAQADLFLAATERARTSLLLEGAPADRIRVCSPGVASDRFGPGAESSTARPTVILSPGRLVWEKGHQDVLRALALLRRGIASVPIPDVRLLIVGTGPEEGRLRAYARELGVADAVEFRGFIPYEEMSRAYAEAACVVLASLPTWSWEEQFGMVLAEAMAGHVPIVTSTCGAIPEVVGTHGHYVAPGDWVGLAQALADGPLAHVPGARSAPEEARLERFSTAAAAARLRAIYDDLLTG
jgi:glycosyltransferase involved in cell wall biosynthesis